MKKNLLLVFVLLLFTFGINTSNAKEFEQPSWQSDYQVVEQSAEDESVRMPSSGSQKSQQDQKQEEGNLQKSDVEYWKFEGAKE